MDAHQIRNGLLRFFAFSLLAVITVTCDGPTGVDTPDTGGSGCDGGGGPLDFSGWYQEALAYPGSIEGVSATDIFGVGKEGSVFRCDGKRWKRMPGAATTSHLWDVWAFDSRHVFAVGEAGAIVFFDGTKWQSVNSGTGASLNAVWGSSATDVYAVGNGGTILHFDGSHWNPQTIADPATVLLDVWGSTANDVFVVGGTAAGAGVLLHFDGSIWSAVPNWTSRTLGSVWGTSGADVFVTEQQDNVFHYDGVAWRAMDPDPGKVNPLGAIWGTSSTNVYVLGDSGRLYRYYGGSTWQTIQTAAETMDDIWGSSAGDIFVACSPEYSPYVLSYERPDSYLHFDGYTWKKIPLLHDRLNSVWGSTRGDGFVVGDDGLILQGVPIDSTRVMWRPIESGTEADLLSVWGTTEESGKRNVIAVGTGGTILTYNGAAWKPMQSGVSVDLSAVWGRLARFIAVGDAGTILRYDGTQWTAMASGVVTDLLAVWGTSMQNVFAVGRAGTIVHYNGNRWATMTGATGADLTGVWGPGPESVFAVGASGKFLYYDGSGWRRSRLADSFDSESDFFTSIWGMSGNLFFAGTTSGLYGFDRTRDFEPELMEYPLLVLDGHSIRESAVAVTGRGEILIYYP